MLDEAPRHEKAPDDWRAVGIALTIFSGCALAGLGTTVLTLLVHALLG
jgi:hypothetical protein